MSHVMVMIRTEAGILMPCEASPQPDGAAWACAVCGELCIRVSFGVMQGLWRCRCGVDVQLLVDGRFIDPREIQPLEPVSKMAPIRPITQEELESDMPKPKRVRKKRIKSDKDFLSQCGIAPLTKPEGDKP